MRQRLQPSCSIRRAKPTLFRAVPMRREIKLGCRQRQIYREKTERSLNSHWAADGQRTFIPIYHGPARLPSQAILPPDAATGANDAASTDRVPRIATREAPKPGGRHRRHRSGKSRRSVTPSPSVPRCALPAPASHRRPFSLTFLLFGAGTSGPRVDHLHRRARPASANHTSHT
jgi:hypothetical protein